MDAWAFGLIGASKQELPGYMGLGERMGLGQADYKALQPVEILTG